MLGGVVRFLAQPGLEEVCDLPKTRGYRRWLVVGRLAQDVCHLTANGRDGFGHVGDGELQAELSGLVLTRAAHGA